MICFRYQLSLHIKSLSNTPNQKSHYFQNARNMTGKYMTDINMGSFKIAKSDTANRR